MYIYPNSKLHDDPASLLEDICQVVNGGHEISPQECIQMVPKLPEGNSIKTSLWEILKVWNNEGVQWGDKPLPSLHTLVALHPQQS